MQFPKSTTAALALFFFALPAIAASSESPKAHATLSSSSAQSSGNAAPGGQVPVPTKEQAKEIANELRTFGSAIETELKQCIDVPGENTAECFNRAKGMNLPKGK